VVGLVLHGLGQPGMGLLLTGVLGLVVLLGGIGLIGLVTHGPFGTPPFARQTLTGRCSGRSRRLRVQRRQRFNWEPQVEVGARGVIIGSATVQAPAGRVVLTTECVAGRVARNCG
jgi:hypothetical protein